MPFHRYLGVNYYDTINSGVEKLNIAGLFMDHDPTRVSGQEMFRNFTGRGVSGRARPLSYSHGSGRVTVIPTRPDLT